MFPHKLYAKPSPQTTKTHTHTQTHMSTSDDDPLASLLLWKWWKGANIPRLCAKTKVRWHHMTPLSPSHFAACILFPPPHTFSLPLLFLVAPAFGALPKIFCTSPLQKRSWWHRGPPLFFVRLPRLSFCPPPVLLLTYSPPQINSHHPFPPPHNIKIYSYVRPPDRPTSIASQPRSPPKLLTWLGHPGQPPLSLSL